MTNTEYHAAEGISSSDFRFLEESPLHLHFKELFRLEGSQFTMGSLVHKMVLEEDTLDEEFACESFDGCELNKNSKAYKEAKAKWLENVGDRIVISVKDWEVAKKMADNVTTIAGGLFKNGSAEESFFVDDVLYGVKRKCRPDYYREDMGIVIDLKTTADGSDRGFAKSLYDYRYHRQAAWYLDTLLKAGKLVSRFIFVTVESKAPYMVRVREIDPVSIEAGRADYESLLKTYKEFLESGKADVIRPITLPAWAMEKETIL
ncbi:PD-(D/E)XK nuclease-like domain-containing protein [Hydrogenimonas sp.]